jgi:hypothetical protein
MLARVNARKLSIPETICPRTADYHCAPTAVFKGNCSKTGDTKFNFKKITIAALGLQ